MFFDPVAADTVLRVAPALGIPLTMVPLDICGATAAYSNFQDQWAVILARKTATATSLTLSSGAPLYDSAAHIPDAVERFVASSLSGWATSVNPLTIFSTAGVPKSLAAALVAADSGVQADLSPATVPVGVATLARTGGVATGAGRTGKVSDGRGSVTVLKQFASAAATTARTFVDRYLLYASMPWPVTSASSPAIP
jgi:hypothetical protein